MKIARLSEDVINQIAAGEVIENPASVVKELIDNSIDAKSSRIEVEIQSGGQQFIKVEDDGCGMDRSDVEMALLRHATSKITILDDLDSLKTMGFRGEALAAIAAISKLEIRTSNGSEGTRLVAGASHINSIEPCARNHGATIEVRSLFFNTPARRKFQKSPQANSQQVVRIVQSLALSHPEIAFLLRSQGQILLDVPVSGWKERVANILGSQIAQDGIWLEQKNFFGLLGPPSDAKATRLGQHFFINRRPVFSPIFAKAIKEGYGTRIQDGSHPMAAIFYECDPGEFDVNVHPQKKEVRFHDESRLYVQLHGAVSRAFLSSSLPDHPSFEPISRLPWEAPAFSIRDESAAKMVREQKEFIKETDGRPLAVVGSFLFIERNREVWLIDLRGAFEQQAIQDKKSSQTLMFPIHLTISSDDSEQLLQRCMDAGLEAKVLGEKKICVDAIPHWLGESDVPAFFDVLKDDLSHGVSLEQTIRHYCRSQPKRFSLEEAELLWKRGGAPEIRLDSFDIEHLFSRKN